MLSIFRAGWLVTSSVWQSIVTTWRSLSWGKLLCVDCYLQFFVYVINRMVSFFIARLWTYLILFIHQPLDWPTSTFNSLHRIRNGKPLGEAFTTVRFGEGFAYFPAVSLSMTESLRANFGATPLRYPLEGYRPLEDPPTDDVVKARVLFILLDRIICLMSNAKQVICFVYLTSFGNICWPFETSESYLHACYQNPCLLWFAGCSFCILSQHPLCLLTEPSGCKRSRRQKAVSCRGR